MASEELLRQISYDKAFRKNRMNAALWVLDHPETIPELLKYCFEDASELSYKAAWVFEFVCLDQLELLYPYLDYFFKNLPMVSRDQAVRPMAHICELLAIQNYKKMNPEVLKVFAAKHKEIMTECSFDWLISNQKVACQVRAMTCLYYLGTEFDWIHSELKQIIDQNIHTGSAGYKARGKRTLSQIEKYRR